MTSDKYLQDGAATSAGAVQPACAQLNRKPKPAPDYNQYWQERSKYRPIGNYTPVPVKFDLQDQGFQFSDNILSWPAVNDPCTVVYNEKDGLYYSWMLYRDQVSDDFPTDWIEMVSEDCINWRQTEKRLIRGVHATRPWGKDKDISFMGGSAWVDKNNRFGFGAGAVLFLVSLNQCMINGVRGGDQCIGFFVAPLGLGTPIDQSKSCLLFAKNPTGTDWRDTRMQWDAENNQLIFVISNHANVQFYTNKTNDIRRFKRTQTFPTGYHEGIECPEFHPIIDSATGEKYWLLVAAKQIPGGGIAKCEQTILWYLGKWNGKVFSSVRNDILEYGYDFYAESVSEPHQSDNPKSFIMRGHIGNWGYTQYIQDWPLKGFIGGCWEDRELYVENGLVRVRPHLKTDGLRARGAPPVKSAPTWIKATLSDKDTSSTYALKWSSGDRVSLNFHYAALEFDTASSGATVMPGKAFAVMPLAGAAEIDIFINGCCVSFYINGKQAGFQVFPRGKLLGLKHIEGALRIKSVKYYDMSPLFA